MDDKIWICDVPRSSEFILGFMPSLRSDDDFLDVIRAYKPHYSADASGQPVSRTQVPDKLFWAGGVKAKFTGPLPACFDCGYTHLRTDVADVFLTADLGEGGLYPVSLYQNDKVTAVNQTVHALNIGNACHTIDPKRNSLKRFIETKEIYDLPYDLAKTASDLVAEPEALEGPDVWADPAVWGVFFISDKLAQRLDQAGHLRALKLFPCRVARAL